MMRRFLIIILLFSGISNFSYGQLISINAKPDTNWIRIGDQIGYTIEITHQKGVNVTFPEFNGQLTDEIEILEERKTDSLLTDDEIKITRSYLITSFDSGLHFIPPIKFAFESSAISDTIETSASYLDVAAVEVNLEEDIKDIRSQYEAPVTLAELLPYILGGLVLVILVLFIIYYIRRKKQDKPIIKIEKPKEPAHQIAFRELELLKTEKLWQQGKIKEYYTRLTDILRIYIEERFNIPAMEQTTDELLDSFRDRGEHKELHYEILRQLLTTADLVKFAKEKPLPDENDGYYKNAYDYVKQTMFIEQKTIEQLKEEHKENDEQTALEEQTVSETTENRSGDNDYNSETKK